MTRGGGRLRPKGCRQHGRLWAPLWFEWATTVLLCMKWLRKQSSHPARCPFPVGKPLSQSGWAVASWAPWLLPAC